MNQTETARILRYLHAAFGTEITNDMAQLWVNTFQSEPFDEVEAAAAEWVREERFFPTPADMRATMRRLARAAIQAPAIPQGASVLTGPEGGFDIAYRAYCQEVERAGREPKSFDEFVGRVKAATS